ncbi:MAG: hypothetical protein K9I59_03230 [Chlorobium sp.]|jgi:hypothetical protein|uniref:hypothetical protein n=1 Tax=Chlorobium sp. TaxID=1095 RepID=UPI001E026B43|nr:hypothetical protein [Chlorobium sp.]MBN1279858.1 hypothetical protein [Chlorobiaceae bacterium]MCF8215858.1 hypothetical protein [Chlorobium sp.]MCF8270756.1 hypothetical protein [Chlorobium sp.]MCF8287068.1 hypothetical protein [Chlorobium sp.]MCF8290725.1 hypothetical protein [Chlorobium sp.]
MKHGSPSTHFKRRVLGTCLLCCCTLCCFSRQLPGVETAAGGVSVSVLVPEVIILNCSGQNASVENALPDATRTATAGTNPVEDNKAPETVYWQVKGFSPGGNACVKVSATCTDPATGKTVTTAATTSPLTGITVSSAGSVRPGTAEKIPPASRSIVTASTI